MPPRAVIASDISALRRSADDIAAVIRGDAAPLARLPGLADGLSGMAFIAAARESSARDGAWVEVAP